MLRRIIFSGRMSELGHKRTHAAQQTAPGFDHQNSGKLRRMPFRHLGELHRDCTRPPSRAVALFGWRRDAERDADDTKRCLPIVAFATPSDQAVINSDYEEVAPAIASESSP